MHDLDGLVRLVALHSEIVAKGVKDEDVPQFFTAADKRYANPWTEKPMQWDAKARQLYFEPQSRRYKDDMTGGRPGASPSPSERRAQSRGRPGEARCPRCG